MMDTRNPPAMQIEVFGIDTDYQEKQYVGDYLYCKPTWAWNVPAAMVFKVTGDHYLVPTFLRCRRKVVPLRTYYHGKSWEGRVMDVEYEWDGKQTVVTIYCMNNLFWNMVMLAWVNPQLPAEVQVGLTGKQDIMLGPLDWVYKWYWARNAIRADVPVYVKLPVHYTFNLPTLFQLLNLDDLLSYLDGLDIIALSARFTRLNELFQQSAENKRIGMTMELVIKSERQARGQALPLVFNTDSLSTLQSILDYTSTHFLDITQLGNIPSQWNSTPSKTNAYYVFDTVTQRDRRHMVWQVDGGQILSYKRKVSHARGSHAIVGGTAPDILNQLIEFGANLAIQAIAGAITAALGLPGVGAIAVGGLFDNIFFAFQHFWDGDLAADLGPHGFKEDMGNNSGAWSLDAASTGFQTLRKLGGDDTLEMTVQSGVGGYEFGADTEVIDGITVDMSHKRFQEGDRMMFYHLGTYVEQWISEVSVEDARDGRVKELVSFGDNKQKDIWSSLFGTLGDLAGLTKAFAVQG